MVEPSPPQRPRLTFPRSHRLSGRRAFAAVFDARLREHAGPMTIFARANDLPHSRLGLSVPRRVGGAVTRNGIKRRLREAFRLRQHELPGGYDWVVAVRPHETLTTQGYAELLGAAVMNLDRKARRRLERK
jgi:ribonuclease P protein component